MCTLMDYLRVITSHYPEPCALWVYNILAFSGPPFPHLYEAGLEQWFSSFFFHASEFLGTFVKTLITVLTIWSFWFTRSCISNMSICHADAAGLGTTLDSLIPRCVLLGRKQCLFIYSSPSQKKQQKQTWPEESLHILKVGSRLTTVFRLA